MVAINGHEFPTSNMGMPAGPCHHCGFAYSFVQHMSNNISPCPASLQQMVQAGYSYKIVYKTGPEIVIGPEVGTCPRCDRKLCQAMDAYYGRDETDAKLCVECREQRRQANLAHERYAS